MARSTSREPRRASWRGVAALALAGLASSARAASPELVIDTATTNSPSAPTAQKILFQARVVNLGTASSPASKVRFYRSTDPTITDADTRLSTLSLDAIAAGRYRMVDVKLSVGTSVGRFWFGACVDAVAGEASATNDCSPGVAVQVGPRPDVAVGNVALTPDRVGPDAIVDATAVVSSVGSGGSGSGTVELRYAPQNLPSPDWDYFASSPVSSLASGTSVQITARATAPYYAGRYWLRACALDVPFDGNAANDCAEGSLTVEGPNVVLSDTAVDDPVPEIGGPFHLSALARNEGTEDAPTRLAFFLAAATPDAFPYVTEQLAVGSVPALAPGESVRVESAVSLVGSEPRYVAVCVPWVPSEQILDDCSPPVRVDVEGVRLDSYGLPIATGGSNAIGGVGFTPGTVVMLYVSGAAGATPYGPFTPNHWLPNEIGIDVPDTVELGHGFVSLEAINTDQGYLHSVPQCRNLNGALDHGPPSITTIAGTALTAVNDCSIPLARTAGIITPGATLDVGGLHFVNPRANLFTPGGSFGPLVPEPGFTADHARFAIPAEVPEGSGTLQIVNEPYVGNVQSNAVLAAIGFGLGIDGVSQAGATVTVTGHGFSPLSVINLFNLQSGSVVNLGGLTEGGTARIPLANLTSGSFTFQRPAGAVAGKAFVEVLNPPFVPITSTGNDPQGAFDLQ